MTALITCAANSSPTAMFCGFSSDWYEWFSCMRTTMCSICGIVSVPAGSPGYGSDPGCRTGRSDGAVRHAPVPATALATRPAFSGPRLASRPCCPS
jgi:hypothetical protein